MKNHPASKSQHFFMKRLHTAAAPKFTKRLFLHCWVDTKDQESTGAFTFIHFFSCLYIEANENPGGYHYVNKIIVGKKNENKILQVS